MQFVSARISFSSFSFLFCMCSTQERVFRNEDVGSAASKPPPRRVPTPHLLLWSARLSVAPIALRMALEGLCSVRARARARARASWKEENWGKASTLFRGLAARSLIARREALAVRLGEGIRVGIEAVVREAPVQSGRRSRRL